MDLSRRAYAVTTRIQQPCPVCQSPSLSCPRVMCVAESANDADEVLAEGLYCFECGWELGRCQGPCTLCQVARRCLQTRQIRQTRASMGFFLEQERRIFQEVRAYGRRITHL